MKQILPLLLATGLAATLAGCQSETEPDVTQSPADLDSADLDAAKFTLVTLKVPNMV
jgi:hypothetical protein